MARRALPPPAMKGGSLYDLSAKAIYAKLEVIRNPYLTRAYKVAALTIPRLCPTFSGGSGAKSDTSALMLDGPRNTVGTKGVNSLSSRMLSTLLPASDTFFLLSVPDDVMQQANSINKDAGAEIESSLRAIENQIDAVVSHKAFRPTIAEGFKHLIVVGNALLHYTNQQDLRMIPLTNYVVSRDDSGELLCLIIQQSRDINTLSADVRAVIASAGSLKAHETDIAVYTKVLRVSAHEFLVHQEVDDGIQVPNSHKIYSDDEMPFIVLRWGKIDGEDYGRSIGEEYLGELVTLESLEQSLVEGTIASARLIGMVNPTGVTSTQDLNGAKNGEFIVGVNTDISFLQIGKHADFSIAFQKIKDIERHVEQAFLLNSTLITDSKNVTATAIRMAAEELESTLGGIYSLFSNSFQLPLVRLVLLDLEKRGATPRLPASLEVSITTGLTALGRQERLTKLQTAFGLAAAVVGPQEMARNTNATNVIRYIIDNSGLKGAHGLVKTTTELAADAQAQQAQAAQASLMQQFAQSTGKPMQDAMSNMAQQAGFGAPAGE